MGDIPIDDHWVRGFQAGTAMPHLLRNSDGSVRFDPERQALHDRIVEGMVGGKHSPAGQPTFHVLGGGPASGKSSLVTLPEGAPLRDPDTAVVELDAARTQLPEWEGLAQGGGADAGAATHEESAYLVARATAAALERGLNVTLDTTGNSTPEALRKRLGQAHAAGYRVEGHYVTVPISVAQQRADERGKQTGRYVPAAGLTAIHAAVSRTLPKVLGEFDHLELYDTRGPRGAPPTPVLTWDGTRETVHDPVLWKEFLDKANASTAPTPEGTRLNREVTGSG
jgi:predicted kinase